MDAEQVLEWINDNNNTSDLKLIAEGLDHNGATSLTYMIDHHTDFIHNKLLER